ncbi:RNA polymerase II mediator complex subunit [Teratosphaeriaceae sp. CCFEE 6253]|nr:RNA polymerase II mediator complex subunit [Teratosphaeriaceae sp. CCFEE 6253]
MARRAVSGSAALYFAKPQARPTLASRLSGVRSASHVIDLTADGSQRGWEIGAAQSGSQMGVVASPDVVAVPHDEEGGRPAKRVKMTDDGSRAGDMVVPLDAADMIVVGGDRLPSLPKTNSSGASTVIGRQRRRGEGDPARKANGTEPPAMAIRLPPPKNVADFSPWTGNHPEDVLNETVIKSGYSDKGPGASECNSAKPAIWPNLTAKNNTGLQMLSYLFTQVMEKRQALGKLSAPSTFKPPPRVTVTDTKREAWLRDLANPEVPLRKQSRTIPHGIRGKLLMDQCLAKDVPLQRAVWLAKCVGANELRAFRRKGVSGVAAATGESKWVREWTVHVEQFLESVIATCGEQGWQLKMHYAVKLVTAFYSEQLLEADHYLDWIVSSFRKASIERLPMWIIVVQLYWKDLVGFVRIGRRLVESVLDHLHSLTQGPHAVNEAIKLRLQKLIAVLAVTNRGCLVMPHTWTRYKELLTPTPSTASTGTSRSLAEQIAKRNERLLGPLSKTPASTRSALLRLYDALDTAGLNIDLEHLVQTCSSLVPSLDDVIAALFDWASSPYRHGLARVYLATRIIRTLRSQAADTDAAMLTYLQRPAADAVVQDEYVFKLIGELVRAEAFGLGPYLRWLISSGAMYSPADAQRAKGLLTALPEGAIPGHLVNLSQTILTRLGGASDTGAQAAKATRRFDDAMAGTPSSSEDNTPGGASLPAKVAIADHVRAYMHSTGEPRETDLASFCIQRDYLELAEDVSAIAELATSSITTDDASLLASIADTTVVHAEVLAALGQLHSITDAIIERYRILRSQQPLERVLVLSLTALVHTVHGSSPTTDFLASDLVICEQQNTAVVCSPASDSLIGMHAVSLDSEADLDGVFASGNTMDDQLLQRVFMRALQHAGKSERGAVTASTSKLSSWLNQLRVVGGSSFEHMVAGFCQQVLKGAVIGLNLKYSIAAIVASGCYGLDAVLGTARSDGGAHAATLAMSLLLSTDVANTNLSTVEKYGYRAAQRSCLWHHPETVTRLLLTACENADFDPNDTAVIDLLVTYTSTRMGVVRGVFEEARAAQGLPPRARGMSTAILKRGLRNTGAKQLDLRAIISMADPLSIWFAAGELWWSATVTGTGTSDVQDDPHSLMIDAIQDGNSVWPQLLGSAISPATKKGLHTWAQDQLLHAAARSQGGANVEECEVVKRHMDVLDLTHPTVQDEDDAAVLATLNDRLLETKRSLSSFDSADVTKVANTSQQLRILLHLCTLRIHPPAISTEANRHARGTLLTTLCAILIHARIQTQPDLAEHLFDLASALSDTLPDSTLANLAHAVRPSDPRVQAILGGSSTASETWLALASQAPPAIGTAQQRALAKHSAQQVQPASGRLAVLGAGHPLHAHPPQPRAWPLAGAVSRAAAALGAGEAKTTRFALRRWEIMPDPTPVMGENDTSLSLGLFGARKV